MHNELYEVEKWLRDHPDADRAARWDMIQRRAELLKEYDAEKLELEKKLKQLENGQSPITHKSWKHY